MKDRLSKISKRATHALCLLAACGLTYSCADEYKLDDEAPTALFGSSIYDYLKNEKGYTNYVRLIDDLGLKDVLSTTGSRTLFVANDTAFQKFYEKNAADAVTNPNGPWANAVSYDKLTKAQKNLLLNSAMLNNAYLMEMLSRAEGTVTRGSNMRKVTSVSLLDSIPILKKGEFPISENVDDKNYWKKYEAKDTFYVVSDNSTPMLVFFSNDFMAKSNINADDFHFILGQDYSSSDYYVYDKKVIKKDITCQNGYIHVLSDVLVPQGNMAEVIRNNPDTKIYSHILDRFSAPYYDKSLSTQYRDNIDPNFKDSIFVRKYYSQITNSQSVEDYLNEYGVLLVGPDKESPSPKVEALKLDPAWNQYSSGATGASASSDMAAMFVPKDKALYDYFTAGEGRDIMEYYAANQDNGSYPDNLAPFYKNLDQIPLSVLNSLVSNLMQKSFVESVPSKFTTILDQANDNLFDAQAKDHVTNTQIANNGVVYFMDKVYPPVDYAAVSSTAYIREDDYSVMKFAIYNGSGNDSKENLMGLNYYAYLRAKSDDIKFAFFLPSDSALKYYVDPLSIIPADVTGKKARTLSFSYNPANAGGGPEKSKIAPLDCKQYSFNRAEGTINTEIKGDNPKQDEYLNRLGDILDTHTIVYDVKQDPMGILGENKYYLTRSGAPVRICNQDGHLRIQGGMQIENQKNYPGQSDAIPGYYYAEVVKKFDKTNGTTYCLDAPILPSVSSVYKVMNDMNNQEFLNLCTGATEELINAVGLLPIDPSTGKTDFSDVNKYLIFASKNGLDENVTFFTKYNYTVYVPTDEAILKEIQEKKLPTWESIQEYVDTYSGDPEWDVPGGYKAKAKAQVELLLNFIRGHFQDESIFADERREAPGYSNSATMDSKGEKFVPIYYHQEGNGKLSLFRDGYYDCSVTDKKNIFARDYVADGVNYSVNNISDIKLVGSTIRYSSYSVVHEIDGTLRTLDLNNGKTYEDYWITSEAAMRTNANFHIKNK